MFVYFMACVPTACARGGCVSGGSGANQLMEGLSGRLYSWRALLYLHVYVHIHTQPPPPLLSSCFRWHGKPKREDHAGGGRGVIPHLAVFCQGAEPFPLQTLKTLVLAPAFPPASQSPQAVRSHGRDGAGVEWRKDQKTLDRKVWSHLISNISQQSVNMIQ